MEISKSPPIREEGAVDEEFEHDFAYLKVPTMIPSLFTGPPAILDSLVTETSKVQDKTVRECLPFLSAGYDDVKYNEWGVPHLTRPTHIGFLKRWLDVRMSHHFVAVDASRPWFLYWCLQALVVLGEDVSGYSEPLIETTRWMQNEGGGFGGGSGHMSHLATTYAVLLALAVVGGDAVYEVVDRKAMWKWLSSLKQPDGGFAMAVGGEVDVRGAYCAAVVISLLNLPLELAPEHSSLLPEGSNLHTGLANYVQRCQTFEGGISGRPDAEAHGAYAFCGLACLAILDAPYRIFPKYLDVPRLISWTSSRQHAPEAGFSGRTNKLVDGCYSHWLGGCWPLVEACLHGPDGEKNGLVPNSQSIFNRDGLIRYILCCCQDLTGRGGLRDKPSRQSDAYHTCYVLAGLSAAQHSFKYTKPDDKHAWKVSPYLVDLQIYDDEDRVSALHPVYVIPEGKVKEIKEYFAAKSGF